MEEIFTSKLGNAIRKKLHDHNETQAEAGKRIYIDQRTISDWVCNKKLPDLQNINAAAALAQIPPGELFINYSPLILKDMEDNLDIRTIEEYQKYTDKVFAAFLFEIIRAKMSLAKNTQTKNTAESG